MKIRIIVLTICIFFIILLQSTVLDYIKIFNVKPNLLLVFIISFALLRGRVEGAVIGFFAGLMQDIASGKVLGLYALLGLYLGLITGLLNKRIYRENLLVILLFTFVSTIVYELSVFLFGTFFREPVNMLFPLQYIILPEAIYNSVISIFMYAFIINLDDKIESADKFSRKY